MIKLMTKVNPKVAKIRMIRNKIFVTLLMTNSAISKTKPMILMKNTVIGLKKTCGFWASSTLFSESLLPSMV